MVLPLQVVELPRRCRANALQGLVPLTVWESGEEDLLKLGSVFHGFVTSFARRRIGIGRGFWSLRSIRTNIPDGLLAWQSSRRGAAGQTKGPDSEEPGPLLDRRC
jgi:hypothetical protein